MKIGSKTGTSESDEADIPVLTNMRKNVILLDQSASQLLIISYKV